MTTCNLCSSFESTDTKYYAELAEEHAKTHFTQINLIDKGITLNKAIEKCFPSGLSMNRETMQDELRKLGKSSSTVECEKCGTSIVIFQSGNLQAGTIIDHACRHLGQKMYKCRQCSREFGTKNAVTRHLTHKHKMSSIGNHESRLRDYVDEISIEIKSCFSTCMMQQDCDGTLIKRKHHCSTVSKLTNQRWSFCRELVTNFADKEGNIFCRSCAKRIKIDRANTTDYRSIMDHALVHLRKPIVRCKICSEFYSNRSSLLEHLKTSHSLPMTNNYERLDDQYHTEIMSILNDCYGDEIRATQPKGVTISARSVSDVLRRVKGSKLMTERRLLCYRLVRNSVDNEQKVECRLCEKRVIASSGNGFISCYHCMQHALVHLKKPIIRCNVCHKTCSNRCRMMCHLKDHHALPLANNATSFADEYHSEIVAILRACYGANTE